MVQQLYFDDFEIGATYESPSKTITDAHNMMFAGLTGDNHPIHYDLEYCQKRGYPEKLAHGLLNASQTALGASSLAPLIHDCIIAFVEFSAKFLKPVFIGDTIYPRLTISELTPKRTSGLMKARVTIHNQRDELVLEGEHTYLLKRRPGEAENS